VNVENLIFYPGVAFVLTVFLGFWLNRLGKPYQVMLFNIHKLVALAGVVLLGLGFIKQFETGPVQTPVIILMVSIAIMAIILFASGTLMSLDKLNYKFLRLLHRVAPVGLVLLGVWFFLGFS